MKFKLIIDQNCEDEIVATVRQKSDLTDYIQSLVEESNDKLVGYYENQIIRLDTDKIECVYSQDNKTFVVYSDKNVYQIKKRLYEVEEILPPTFIRINKSAIANSKSIKKFVTIITGSVNVEFKSGYVDYVSRRCFAQIKRSYELWINI